ncbi:MAG: C40 family peptidase [Chloroflexota bacterium]
MTTTSAVRVAMVAPPRGVVQTGVVPVRAEPDASAEQVDQALWGEVVTRLGERGDWIFVQGPDLYFGWIPSRALGSYGGGESWIVAVPLAAVRSTPVPGSDVVDELPVGSPLRSNEREGEWWCLPHDRYVRIDDTIDMATLPQRPPTPGDLVTTAESFLGVPYLWGGTSAHGIDCSGLTQQVYRLNGVGLDRDADQQALGGRPVDVARPGDLFFFGDTRVTHTAVATGATTFIHAPQAGQSVQRGELTADRSRLRSTRRYLP